MATSSFNLYTYTKEIEGRYEVKKVDLEVLVTKFVPLWLPLFYDAAKFAIGNHENKVVLDIALLFEEISSHRSAYQLNTQEVVEFVIGVFMDKIRRDTPEFRFSYKIPKPHDQKLVLSIMWI
jgi:hypothetical protein